MSACKGKTQTGRPCQMAPLKGSAYCFTHNPEAAAARALAHRKGGEAQKTPHFGDPKGVPRDVKTLGDAKAILRYTLAEVLGMENSLERSRVLLAIHESYIRSFEIGELEARIAALEAAQKEKR